MNNEIWKDIKGYKGCYQISSYGRVKSLERKSISGKAIREKILKNTPGLNNYMVVNLFSKDGVKRTFRVSDLVMQAFNERYKRHRDLGHWVHNKNGDKSDCRLENLIFLTPMMVSGRNWTVLNRARAGKGSKQHLSKLDETQVKWIKVYLFCGYKQQNIGEAFGVSSRTINAINVNLTWNHVSASDIIDFLK